MCACVCAIRVSIAHGRFFVFFNDLLSSGEITDLYPSEDYK